MPCRPIRRARLAALWSPSSRRSSLPIRVREKPAARAGRHAICLSNLPRFGPGLKRSPHTAIEPEAIDRGRVIADADAAQLDARPLEATLLQHAARRRVADTRPSLQRLMSELAETVIDHGANRFGRVASVPERHADPIAELSPVR